MRRHRWAPNPDAPDREDMKVCARPGCGMVRNDYGSQRYEYRTRAWRYLVTQKRTWPAPPCVTAPTQKDKP